MTNQITADLVEALGDVVEAQLGRYGSFPRLSTERTEEILLLLLRAGRVVKAHTRLWRVEVPADLAAAARAAGGFLTQEEYEAARAARQGT
jgi:hypothetical protein